jgi:hypothetical protein
MAIGINWAEIWAPVWAPVWSQTPATPVPDVVGMTEANGTTALQADGFVVAVTTAYSSTIAVGIIISQDPIAGSTPGTGATVTITVSLGPAPVQAGRTPAGGYDKFRKASRADEERDEDKRKLRAIIEAAIAGDKPVSVAARAVIAAEPEVVADVPAQKLTQLADKAEVSRMARVRVAELERVIENARRQRILKDDEDFLKLLGARGLLQ